MLDFIHSPVKLLTTSTIQHFVQHSDHLPVHGDDVSDEGTSLDRCDVSIGDPVGQGRLGTAGHPGAWSSIGDEDGLVDQDVVSRAVDYRGQF